MAAAAPTLLRALRALPHRQREWLHAGGAKPAHDIGVGGPQLIADGAAELGLQHFAHFGPLAHCEHAANDGVADDFRAQRVAHRGLAHLTQQRSDIAVELAQLPLAAIGHVEGKAFGGDLLFHLLVFDQG